MITEYNETLNIEWGAAFDQNTPKKFDLLDKYSSYFSLFKAPISNKVPSKSVDIKDICETIKGDSFAERTNKLRSINSQDDAKKFKVSNFDFVTFSGVFFERTTSYLIKQSLYICVDLDHVGDIAEIRRMIKLILDKLPPALMFISPSGDGLKVVFKINPKAGSHLQYFRALQRFFADEIGFKIDPSGSDICRACFLPHDPDVYYNPEGDILDNAFIDSFLQVDGQGVLKSEGIQSPQPPVTVDSDVIINQILTWLNKRESFINGNRNNYISKLAYACNRYGLSENEALSTLLGFTETGFTENEIRSISKSVYKHTEWHGTASFNKQQPFDYKIKGHELNDAEVPPDPSLQATPPLPITGFPFHIQALIKECARVYGTPQDFWAVAFLQATAIAVGSTFEIDDKYTNGAVFWIGIIAPTGIGKSEPMAIALRPIYHADSAAEKIYNDKMVEYDAIMNLSPKERKEQGIDIQEHPRKIQYIAIDSTPESLIEAHQENPRGIAIVRDELVGWIADFGRYARSGEVQNMLSAWSEKFFKVTRKGNKSATIEKPFIPVFGGIQPAKLYMLAKDDRALDGFMQRFIFAYPDQCIKPDYHEESLGKSYLNYYQKYIESLLNLSGKRNPIRLSQEAKKRYREFFNHNTALINSESNEYIKGVYQKLEIIVLRLTLVLHISNHVDDGLFHNLIQPETMQDAIEMTEYFRITAKKVNQIIGNTTSESFKLDDRSVAQYLMKTGKITKSALATALGTSRSQLDRLLTKPSTPAKQL